MMKRAVALLCVAGWFGASDARGHHGSGSSFAGSTQAGFARARLETPLPRWSSALGWELSHYGRLREGSQAYPGPAAGSLLVQSLVLDTRVELAFDVAFGVRQPVASITARPTRGPATTLRGLADTSVYAAHALQLAGTPGVPGALSLELSSGLTLPTGRYETQALLSLSEVEPGPDGGLELLTHDTRSSPGAGAFAVLGGADLGWQWLEDSEWLGRLSAVVPASETPDGILWGSDWTLALSNRLALLDAFFLEPGSDLRWHLANRVPSLEPESLGTSTRRSGERREVGGFLAVGVALGENAHCSLRGHVPLWQHVSGVQLTESFSIAAGCMVALGL